MRFNTTVYVRARNLREKVSLRAVNVLRADLVFERPSATWKTRCAFNVCQLNMKMESFKGCLVPKTDSPSTANAVLDPSGNETVLILVVQFRTMMLTAGTRLGTDEILELIGKGGMGEVYRAPRHAFEPHRCHQDFRGTVQRARFEQGIRAVAALNHPNICTLHDVGPNYLVMEHIEGARAEGSAAGDESGWSCAGQVLDALDAAHRKGFVAPRSQAREHSGAKAGHQAARLRTRPY